MGSNEPGQVETLAGVHQYATTVSVRTFMLAVRITLITTVANAQTSAPTGNERLPRFEHYPVAETYKGPPAPAKLRRPGDRLFRTRIREAAAKGPNCAGH